MSLPLLRKEAQEHGPVLFATYATAALALLVLLIDADEQGGRFIALVRYAYVAGALTVLIVANRLLVREYAGRTQLFLEALPLTRLRVFTTKWLLGAALALLSTFAAWALSLAWIKRSEIFTLAQALGPLASVLTYALTLWSFAAMAAMLGRYRYIAWVALAGLLLGATSVGGLAWGDLPILRLLGSDVQMAQGLPEPSAFAIAALFTVICTMAAAALALVGSGATAMALAQRMTAREVVFVFAAALTASVLIYTMQPKPEPPPFRFVQQEPYRGEHAQVGVMPTRDLELRATETLANVIVRDLDTFVEALHMQIRPAVFIVPQQGLDPWVMQRAPLDSQGIVLKIAPDAPLDSVRALVLHSLLGDYTHARGYKEDRHVLLDGVSTYWALQHDADAQALWALRAASLEPPVTAQHLTQWSQTSERVGDCVSQGLALSVFEALLAQLGSERTFELMRRVFPRPPDDVRALFEASPEQLLEGYGLTWDALARGTELALAQVRREQREALTRRPDLRPVVTWENSPTEGVRIEVAVEGAQQFAAYSMVLQPWTADVLDMPRFDVRGERAVLPLSPPPGARVLVVLEVDDPVLRCPVRVYAERVRL